MMQTRLQNALTKGQPAIRRDGRRAVHRGFTLIEMVTAVVVISVLGSIAVPTFQSVAEQARVAKASGDLSALASEIDLFFVWNDRYPASLSEIGMAGRTDPWGNEFVYLRLDGNGNGNGNGNGKGGNGKARKDRFLVPLNSDYDLYSVGKDGKSSSPLTAAASRDDVVRAMDGGYIGLAEKF